MCGAAGMSGHTHIHSYIHTHRTTTVIVHITCPLCWGYTKNKMEIIYNNYNYDAGCEVV